MNPDTDALRTLFASPFSPGKWTGVLADLFGVRHAADGQLLERPRPVAVPDADGFFLGRFTTSDGYLVGLFRCEIAAGSVLRRRVGLRNLVHRYLGNDFDAALAVFTERGSGAWRFSFICDLKGEATAPKRFTYVFGVPGIPLRTPVGRFAALAASREPDRPVSMVAMRDAFSVEALSDEFFAAYKEHYETFVARITGKRFVKQGGKWVETATGRPDRTLYRTFGNDDKRVRDYVKKMLGRLVFLHFLQKKGWLGARRGGWTGGDPAFLLHLFEKATPAQQTDFLDDVLEKLFFNALNTDRSARGDLFDTGVPGIGECRIPYLNGGLFERDDLDDLRVRFPAACFRDLLGFFSEYNFTIDENDADEAEVGIDPEMLGRIFENLLEDNKDKGAFYTPKEIVRYMCRRSLLAHLAEGEKEKDAAAIAAFLETRDPAPLPKTLVSRLAAKLRDIKICDPAIGSGAFPMGLLRELHDLRTALEPATPGLKRQIIENSIYGVDIEKGAVDIARLRFWLALVVDADSPTPLPNLDFKIMQGNSLVESWKGHDLSKLTERKLVGEQLLLLENEADIQRKHLRDLLHQWFACSDHREREQLRASIHATVEKQVRTEIPDFSFGKLDPSANSEFFLWHLWFAEVFDQGGFDIVIGNPPFINAITQIANPTLAVQRKAILDSKRYVSLFEKWDIYIVFLELGLRHLLRTGGVLSMIVPYPLTNQNYAKKMRELIMHECNLLELSDLRGVKVFREATVTNCIPFIIKQPSLGTLWISRAGEDGHIRRCFHQPFDCFIIEKHKAVWNTDEIKRDVTRHADMRVLGDYCYISVGMVLNSDENAKEKFVKADLVSDSKDRIHCKPYIEGKDLERYVIKRIRYLEYGTNRSPAKLRRPTFEELYTNRKLLVNSLGNMKCSLDANAELYCEQQVRMALLWCDLQGVENKSITSSIKKFSKLTRDEMESLSITMDLRYLLGVMNSRYASHLLNNLRGGDYHIVPEHIRNIPIPFATGAVQKRMATLVDRILSAKAKDPDTDTTSDERRIDELVYKLYGLTPEEIAVVEGSTS